MNLPPCPQPPDWKIDWPTLDAFPWIRDLKGCPQNPVRHAEGDVWTHVHMVCEAMVGLEVWRNLPEYDRRILFTAALFHDVAKPACTRVEADGSISSRGHSWRGAIRTRHTLWKRGIPFHDREKIAALVRHHLVPFFLADSEHPARLAVEVSQTARCDWLSILAESDARGRTCPDPDHLLQQIAAFRQQIADSNCVAAPFSFESEEARFAFFHPTNKPNSDVPTERSTGTPVVMLSGLPGVGKDYWLQKHLPAEPVIGLDALRAEMGVAPSDPQGIVLNRAREMAREYLTRKQSFVWNATNLSRHVRAECVRLFQDHGARIRIVYIEVSPDRLFAQNRSRKKKVPEPVIERLLDRWEVPDPTEAHHVDYVVG